MSRKIPLAAYRRVNFKIIYQMTEDKIKGVLMILKRQQLNQFLPRKCLEHRVV